MFAIATFVLAALATAVAQAPPPPGAMPAQPLESGACLDSARAVPQVLQPPISRAMQLVRIDEVISTATMMPGEIIGFLYTTSDGSTWLGQRSNGYISPATATAINQVLAATRLPGENVTEFPPLTRYGVATKYAQFFKVRIAPARLAPFVSKSSPAWRGRPGAGCRIRGCRNRISGVREGVVGAVDFVLRARLATFQPNADVFVDEEQRRLVAVIELAGADPETLRIAFDERYLLVTGSRVETVRLRRGSFVQKEIAHGEFVKRIRLPVAIEYERLAASYEDGLLIVVAPIAVTAYMPTARTELHVLVKRSHS